MDTKLKKFKAVIALICFVISISIFLVNLPIVAGYLLCDYGYATQKVSSAFEKDYQNTREFKNEISNRLNEFLAMAAGGVVDYYNYGYDYDTSITQSYAEDGWNWDWDWSWSEQNSASVTAETKPSAELSLIEDEVEQLESEIDDIQDKLYNISNEMQNLDDDAVRKEKEYQLTELRARLTSIEQRLSQKVNDLETQRNDYQTKLYQQRAKELNEQYQKDKNLLYIVTYEGKTKFTNAEGTTLDPATQTLPEGYNFLLYFDGNKATAIKDGNEINLYGNGIYLGENANSEWKIPGYENYTAGESANKTTVCLAVQKNPLNYLEIDYSKSNTVHQSNTLYHIVSTLKYNRMEVVFTLTLLIVGVLLLLVYILLRKSKATAEKAIAKGTGRVLFEIKLFAVFLVIASCVILFKTSDFSYYRTAVAEMLSTNVFSTISLLAGRLISDGGLYLLISFWMLYLFINDMRYNKKSWQHSICGKVRRSRLKLPIQRVMTIRTCIVIAVVTIMPILHLTIQYNTFGSIGPPLFLLLYLFVWACVVAVIIIVYKKNDAIRDISRLTDMIEAVRSGNLNSSLDLPEDVELKAAADHLNDIGRGMKIAMDEQIKSERMKVELVSNVSHDIKTPLTSIVSYVDLLKQEENLPDHIKEYIAVLDTKAMRLKDIVADVFEVSKAASGQLSVKLEELDLGKLIRQTLADMSEQIEKSTILIKTDIPEAPVIITADGTRLYRVFQNLMQNALSYSLNSSRVFVSLKLDGNKAIATIQNTSKTELSLNTDYTERFVRGDNSRSDGGTGLGLSIAKSFTEACNGSFEVENIADLFTVKVEFKKM